MFDTILWLDDSAEVACTAAHRIRSLQTKDFSDPSMRTYLVHRGRLLLTSTLDGSDDADQNEWRIESAEAVREQRFALTEVTGPRTLRAYASCPTCQPVLVRTDGGGWPSDLVAEHNVFVDFMFTWRPGEPLQIQRTSGSRDDMKAELRARGLCVLGDDEPLAIAHREVRETRRRRGLRADLFTGS
jgi:hypothetical protein